VNEKPTKVEIGQRWTCVSANHTKATGFKVTERASDGVGWLVYWDDHVSGYWSSEALLAQCDFVSSPTPAPVSVRARNDGRCPLCLDEVTGLHWECTADETGRSGWIKCSHDKPEDCACPSKRLVDAGSPQPSPVAPTGAYLPVGALAPSRTVTLDPGQAPREFLLTGDSDPAKNGVYRYTDGQWMRLGDTPKTALEAIQAKPKPEPWVESCDPLHWIPDA